MPGQSQHILVQALGYVFLPIPVGEHPARGRGAGIGTVEEPCMGQAALGPLDCAPISELCGLLGNLHSQVVLQLWANPTLGGRAGCARGPAN